MKAIILSLLVIISVQVFSQQTASLTKADYLQKSKHQKTAAWILLGGGFATTIAGNIIYKNAFDKAAENDPWVTLFSFGTNVDPAGAIIACIGTLAMLGSIPEFIASGRNKRKANSLSAAFKIEEIPIARGSSFTKTNYPALSLKLIL